ncbi:MAG TPA: HipA domain-containing protein [Planctomycetota bacterium]|nr:HipA domain-containing protein [Planctomycetota bacterium]
MTRCLSCAEVLPDDRRRYHTKCLRVLFGTEELPGIDIDLARLHTLALSMVGRVSLSGVQRKLSVQLDSTRATLQIALANGRFVLKPQAGTFPNLPENEWVTQRLAELAGIEVPPAALVELTDGTWAYLVRRFDRRDDGSKLAMEDFCQLAELPPSGKYDGSAERCGQLVKRYVSEPLVDLLRLYRQFVFTWWVGNGDLHLKNLAILRGDDQRWRLSPAYDQLNTRLVLPDDPLALPLCGKRDNLKPETWRTLAERFGIGPKAAERVLAETRAALPGAIEVVRDSPLPAAMREQYEQLLTERAPH